MAGLSPATRAPRALLSYRTQLYQLVLGVLSLTRSPSPSLARSDKTPAALFFRYNTQLGPPYQVIIDTNFINFSIRNKVRAATCARRVAFAALASISLQ